MFHTVVYHSILGVFNTVGACLILGGGEYKSPKRNRVQVLQTPRSYCHVCFNATQGIIQDIPCCTRKTGTTGYGTKKSRPPALDPTTLKS